MPIRGLASLQIVRVARRAGIDAGPLGAVRTDAGTVAQVRPWLDAVGDRPALVWIQLAGPSRTLDGAGLAAAVAELDSQVGRLREDVAEAAGTRPVTFAVVGTRGQPMGEHPGGIGRPNLHDESVRVPLLVQPHVMKAIRDRHVSMQVRLMDVPAALLALWLDPLPDAEGNHRLAQGLRTRHYASLLALPRGPGEGGPLLVRLEREKMETSSSFSSMRRGGVTCSTSSRIPAKRRTSRTNNRTRWRPSGPACSRRYRSCS